MSEPDWYGEQFNALERAVEHDRRTRRESRRYLKSAIVMAASVVLVGATIASAGLRMAELVASRRKAPDYADVVRHTVTPTRFEKGTDYDRGFLPLPEGFSGHCTCVPLDSAKASSRCWVIFEGHKAGVITEPPGLEVRWMCFAP